MIRAVLLFALVGCGSVALAPAPDASSDAAGRSEVGSGGAAGDAAPPADAGAAGAGGAPIDAGRDYGPAPGPRPGVPDGGWVGGIVGNCYDIPCADGSHRAAAGATCAPSRAGAPICIVCAGWPDAPGPACVTNATGRAGPPSFYVHDCADPVCQ